MCLCTVLSLYALRALLFSLARAALDCSALFTHTLDRRVTPHSLLSHPRPTHPITPQVVKVKRSDFENGMFAHFTISFHKQHGYHKKTETTFSVHQTPYWFGWIDGADAAYVPSYENGGQATTSPRRHDDY